MNREGGEAVGVGTERAQPWLLGLCAAARGRRGTGGAFGGICCGTSTVLF